MNLHSNLIALVFALAITIVAPRSTAAQESELAGFWTGEFSAGALTVEVGVLVDESADELFGRMIGISQGNIETPLDTVQLNDGQVEFSI